MDRKTREYKDIAKYAMGALHTLLEASKGAGIVQFWDQANVAYYNCKERLKRLDEAGKEG